MLDNEKPLFVFHISTSLKGGAGLAATRLHLELLRRGIHSRLLSLDQGQNIENTMSINRNLLQMLSSKLFALINLKLSHKVFFSIYLRNVLRMNTFTSPISAVLHIHNWYNLTDFKFLEKLAKKGFLFVFTLHDERNFTGGCHYRFDCMEFHNSCSFCPEMNQVSQIQIRKNWLKQKDFFDRYHSQIRIIAPSKWILGEAMSSNIFGESKLFHIPNFTPTNLGFETRNRTKNLKTFIVGVASMEPYSEIKGGKFLINFEKAIRNHKSIELVTLRDLEDSNLSHNEFWSVIDVLLVPSILDNSPNVIHEAKLLGIPVLATNVGGIPELLTSEYDFIFEKTSEPSKIIEHIERMELPLKREIAQGYLDYISGNVDQLIHQYHDLMNSQFPK